MMELTTLYLVKRKNAVMADALDEEGLSGDRRPVSG